MISGSNEQLQQQLEYILLKPDCHSWWISKMQSGREDTLEERYTIKFYFKHWKNATETYGMLQTAFGASCMNQFLSGLRDSRKAGSLWGIMRGVRGVSKSIHQSWLAKGLGLGLLCWDSQQRIVCWGLKGVQEEIPSEEASILQIGSVAFPPGQCTSPQLHLCHRLFDQMGIKTVPHPPDSRDLAPCDFWLFPKLRGCRYETIEEMKEVVTNFFLQMKYLKKSEILLSANFQKMFERRLVNKCKNVVHFALKLIHLFRIHTHTYIYIYIYIYIYSQMYPASERTKRILETPVSEIKRGKAGVR